MDAAATISVGRPAADFPFNRLRLADPEMERAASKQVEVHMIALLNP